MTIQGRVTVLIMGFFFFLSNNGFSIQLKSRIQYSKKSYGRAQGLVIDFDSITPSGARITSPLRQGTTYSVDSLSLRIDPRNEEFFSDVSVYIAVYSSLSESEELSGFLGVSKSSVVVTKDSPNTFYTWSFSGITVTPEANPGQGKDCLFFIFQRDKMPQTRLNDLNLPLSRSETFFKDTLATIVRRDFKKTILRNRTPNYRVMLTRSLKKRDCSSLLTTPTRRENPSNLKAKTSKSIPSKKKKPTHPSGIIAFATLILLLFQKKNQKAGL